MQYRVNCLPQAREHARRMNSAGARYPWMASYDGSEQCESWDIGASEVHVTADVVYALDLYARVTGDAAFARQAEEVYIETACFWRSRYTSAPDGTSFDLLFCKGPDEYCGITSNNLFTNVMVRHNLHLALAAARRMQRKDPDRFAALCLSEEELAGWQALEQGIQIPRDPVTGHLRADDSFQLLEPVDPATLKQGDAANYHQVCFDRLQRYQVIKQADTLLAMTRLPDAFTPQEKQAAWQAVVFGFAGLHFTAGGPALAPTCLTAGRACISVSTGTAPRTEPMCAAIPPEGYRQASSSARNEQRQIFRKRADV